MADTRDAMDSALKATVVTALRQRGFTGSLPHLRRRSPEQIRLVSVQYFSSGGSFVVEVAECAPDGLTTSWGVHIEPRKVTAQNVHPPARIRIGGESFPSGDPWFVFAPRYYEPGADTVQPAGHYAAVADDVLRAIDEHAEPFWNAQLAARRAAGTSEAGA
jgi:hypothetical protein